LPFKPLKIIPTKTNGAIIHKTIPTTPKAFESSLANQLLQIPLRGLEVLFPRKHKKQKLIQLKVLQK